MGDDMDRPQVDGFRIERLLGAGSYGRVYLAHEEAGLQRPVALKLFLAAAQEAYQRELEALRRVEELRRQGRHETLLQALGSGQSPSGPWIALEYLEEGNLAEQVAAKGPLPWKEALEAIEQAAAGVAVLHGAGLFHRDIKPENLLRGSDGRVRLGDFGLSRDLEGTATAAGSPAFAPPEVIGCQVDPAQHARVDVYGLGATLAYLLTGAVARPGRPDAFALARAGVPRALSDLILSCMAYEPEERPADAGLMLEALQEIAGSNPLREDPRTFSEAHEGVIEETPMTMLTKIKSAFASPAALAKPSLSLRVEHPRCPFCRDQVRTAADKRACASCMAWHHAECWEEHGACAACQAGQATGGPAAEHAAPRPDQRGEVAAPGQGPSRAGTLTALLLGYATYFVLGIAVATALLAAGMDARLAGYPLSVIAIIFTYPLYRWARGRWPLREPARGGSYWGWVLPLALVQLIALPGLLLMQAKLGFEVTRDANFDPGYLPILLLLSPWAEELFARGWAYPMTKRAFGPVGGALLVSTTGALLGLKPQLFLAALTSYLIATLAYEQTGRLSAAVLTRVAAAGTLLPFLL